jgi:hypothetical protein
MADVSKLAAKSGIGVDRVVALTGDNRSALKRRGADDAILAAMGDGASDSESLAMLSEMILSLRKAFNSASESLDFKSLGELSQAINRCVKQRADVEGRIAARKAASALDTADDGGYSGILSEIEEMKRNERAKSE